MKDENLLIHFQWNSKQREFLVCATHSDDMGYRLPMYQVFKDNKYLFSMYPAVAPADGKCWELIEKEKAGIIPSGFVALLGNVIDEYYINR